MVAVQVSQAAHVRTAYRDVLVVRAGLLATNARPRCCWIKGRACPRAATGTYIEKESNRHTNRAYVPYL